MPIIHANNVSCQRGQFQLFKPVTFELALGQSLLISGINGIGKTTLLESLAGLRNIQHGQFSYKSHELSKGKDNWFEESLFIGHKSGNKKELTCLENICSYLSIQGKSINNKQAETALEEVGLAGYEYQFAGSLSAGQKKRLALARLILVNNPVWILDEPFVNLDTAGCDWLLGVIKKHLNSDGVLIITAHDNKAIAQSITQEITLEALL
jgi:heme exporter protein A